MNTVLTLAIVLAVLALAIGVIAWLRDDASPEEQSWYDL